MTEKLKLGVLISGRGTNLQALIHACADPEFPATIVRVISNVPGAAGLKRAEDAEIPTAVVDHKSFNSIDVRCTTRDVERRARRNPHYGLE